MRWWGRLCLLRGKSSLNPAPVREDHITQTLQCKQHCYNPLCNWIWRLHPSSVGGSVAFSNPPPWSWSRGFCWLFFFISDPSVQGGSRGNIMELHPEALCIIWCSIPIVFMYISLSFLVVGHFFCSSFLLNCLWQTKRVLMRFSSRSGAVKTLNSFKKMTINKNSIYWRRKTQKSNPVIIYDLFIVKKLSFLFIFSSSQAASVFYTRQRQPGKVLRTLAPRE